MNDIIVYCHYNKHLSKEVIFSGALVNLITRKDGRVLHEQEEVLNISDPQLLGKIMLFINPSKAQKILVEVEHHCLIPITNTSEPQIKTILENIIIKRRCLIIRETLNKYP